MVFIIVCSSEDLSLAAPDRSFINSFVTKMVSLIGLFWQSVAASCFHQEVTPSDFTPSAKSFKVREDCSITSLREQLSNWRVCAGAFDSRAFFSKPDWRAFLSNPSQTASFA